MHCVNNRKMLSKWRVLVKKMISIFLKPNLMYLQACVIEYYSDAHSDESNTLMILFENN